MSPSSRISARTTSPSRRAHAPNHHPSHDRTCSACRDARVQEHRVRCRHDRSQRHVRARRRDHRDREVRTVHGAAGRAVRADVPADRMRSGLDHTRYRSGDGRHHVHRHRRRRLLVGIRVPDAGRRQADDLRPDLQPHRQLEVRAHRRERREVWRRPDDRSSSTTAVATGSPTSPCPVDRLSRSASTTRACRSVPPA